MNFGNKIYNLATQLVTKTVRNYSNCNLILNSTRTFSSVITNTDQSTQVLKHQKIRVLDADINYVQTDGNGSHVLLLLPGTFSSIELDFLPLIGQINKDKFKVVAWDPPGYGRSRPPNFRPFSPETLDREAKYLIELMKKLGHEKYSILSWSAATFSAFKMALQSPSSVRKIVLWGAFGYWNNFTDAVLSKLAKAGLASLQEQRRKELLDMYGEEILLRMWKNWAESKGLFINAGFEENGHFTTDVLSKLKCPTLVVHGLKDGLVQVDQAHYLHKHIPNSKLHLMPNSHHNLHVGHVQEFTKITEEFLEQD